MNADVEKAVEDLDSLHGLPEVAEMIRQALRDQEAEIADLKVDRDSWADQASDRVKDWDDMRQRAEKAEALLQEALRYLDRNQGDACAVADRITAHLGGEHE